MNRQILKCSSSQTCLGWWLRALVLLLALFSKRSRFCLMSPKACDSFIQIKSKAIDAMNYFLADIPYFSIRAKPGSLSPSHVQPSPLTIIARRSTQFP